jgi:hypothetical protein
VSVSSEVIEAVAYQSAIMKLSRTIRMPAGVEKIPVVSVAPQAGFVNPTYGGHKPQTTVEWTSMQIVPEEIACIVPVPNAFIDDAGFPVWQEIRDLIAGSIAFTFDDAALNGNGAPATYPAGGLIAAAGGPAPATGGANEWDNISAALGQLEAQGFTADGILGGAALAGVMRSMFGFAGVMPTTAAPTTIFGLSYATTSAWDYTKAQEMVGDFDYSLVGIRQDIRFEMSTDGVITDVAGKVLVNAFQDDTTLMRVYTRVGYAIGKPLGAIQSDGTRTAMAPFWLAGAPGTMTLAAPAAKKS